MPKQSDKKQVNSINALITGASKGIGLTIARALINHCNKLVLVASSQESFSQKIKKEFGEKTEFYGADFSAKDGIEALAEDLAVKYDKFDVVINNAEFMLKAHLVKPHFLISIELLM